jgi:hypothetical protein
MKHTIILSAPYMMSSVERFRKVIEGYYGINMIVPEVKQKLTEDQIISYAVNLTERSAGMMFTAPA